ncbi:hypothetical protein NUACC21_39580 [Scytonema sp. NUACC21]
MQDVNYTKYGNKPPKFLTTEAYEYIYQLVNKKNAQAEQNRKWDIWKWGHQEHKVDKVDKVDKGGISTVSLSERGFFP